MDFLDQTLFHRCAQVRWPVRNHGQHGRLPRQPSVPTLQLRAGTGPRPILGGRAQAGADWDVLNIARSRRQVHAASPPARGGTANCQDGDKLPPGRPAPLSSGSRTGMTEAQPLELNSTYQATLGTNTSTIT